MANPTTPPNPTPKKTSKTTTTTPAPKKANPTPAPEPTPTPATKKTTTSSSEGAKQGISQDVIDQLSKDVNLMLSFASKNGIVINTEINPLIQDSSVDDIILAYNLLCKNVAPATPKSIEYSQKMSKDGREKSIFNKIPLVRNLIILAILFLVAYVWLGLSPHVNNESLDKGVMNNNGIPLLYNIGYLASIAGLGVLFHLLKSIRASVENTTLVPEEAINYMSQIILGVISGLLISEVISFYSTDPEDINLFNKSVLALIGGFSSDAIFTVLEGLITRLKAIFVPAVNPPGQ